MNRWASLVAAALTAFKLNRMDQITVISKNYTVDDVKRSATAESLGIEAQNTLPDEARKMARRLAMQVIEPANKFTGNVATVRSWWRSDQLNAALPNASPTSVHKTGRAADLELWVKNADGEPMERNDLLARALVSDLKFDRLIVYGNIRRPRFLHVEVAPVGRQPRNRILHYNDNGEFRALDVDEAVLLYG